MKLTLPPSRTTYFILLALSIFIVAVAIYLQETYGLDPCPLCVIQRVVFLIAGLVCLCAATQNPHQTGQKAYAYILLVVAIIGLLVAGRQLWIQYMPHEAAVSCGAGIGYLFQNLSTGEALKIIFQGTGECQTTGPRFAFLTITEWSFILFLFYAIVAVLQIKRARKPKWQ